MRLGEAGGESDRDRDGEIVQPRCPQCGGTLVCVRCREAVILKLAPQARQLGSSSCCGMAIHVKGTHGCRPCSESSTCRLSEGPPELSRHLAHEGMNRDLRDTVADDRVHGLYRDAEWWFITSREIQLRFSSSQGIDRKLSLHEREQPWHGYGLPLEEQARGGSRHGCTDLFLDLLDGNADIGLDSHTADVDVQLGSDCVRAGSRCLRCRLEHAQWVLRQRIADVCVAMVHVVVATNLPSFSHERRAAQRDRLPANALSRNCTILRDGHHPPERTCDVLNLG